MNGKFSKQPSEHNRENIAWIGRYFLTMDIESFQVRRIPLCRDQLRMEKQGQSLEWGFFMTLDNHYYDKMVSYHGTSIIPHDLEDVWTPTRMNNKMTREMPVGMRIQVY